MRPDGGKSSILIRFQLRLGSGSTRGSMAMNSPQAEAARRLKLRRSWTCQFKIELVLTTIRQEKSVWNGHYGCTCYHPLFVFNQFGDLERSASQRN